MVHDNYMNNTTTATATKTEINEDKGTATITFTNSAGKTWEAKGKAAYRATYFVVAVDADGNEWQFTIRKDLKGAEAEVRALAKRVAWKAPEDQPTIHILPIG